MTEWTGALGLPLGLLQGKGSSYLLAWVVEHLLGEVRGHREGEQLICSKISNQEVSQAPCPLAAAQGQWLGAVSPAKVGRKRGHS